MCEPICQAITCQTEKSVNTGSLSIPQEDKTYSFWKRNKIKDIKLESEFKSSGSNSIRNVVEDKEDKRASC